jgi:hypothetical protein
MNLQVASPPRFFHVSDGSSGNENGKDASGLEGEVARTKTLLV